MSRIRKAVRRKTNPNLVTLIDELLKISAESGARVWKDVAERLAKPRRLYAEVNLTKIERYANPGEIVVIPGKVLGGGEISKSVKVAALSFSESAKRKIVEAGGECLKLIEAARANSKGSNVRILV